MTRVLIFFILAFPLSSLAEVRVGSKAFTEGFLLAELAAQKIEGKGQDVQRKFGLGNTGISIKALDKGEIDLYPEYTGTLREAILGDVGGQNLIERLKERGLAISKPLGFNNTYALAVTKDFSEKNGVNQISDLRKVQTGVRCAFSHEFVSRKDGLRNLTDRYGLDLSANRESLEHSLAYRAVAGGQADLIDVYSTDSQIQRLGLVVLKDDLGFFPDYEAVYLARVDFVHDHPEVWAAVRELEGTLTAEQMRHLNAEVELNHRSFSSVIDRHLHNGVTTRLVLEMDSLKRIWQRTKEHSFLVGVTLLISILTGVPLGILAVRRRRLGQFLLVTSAVVQTIPSLALLCLLIPLFGIGTKPALVALYLYGLLPILLNTFVGLKSIDPHLIETARALGLNSSQRIFWIELPLASRSILGGIKTALIIGIGTATLAALIGAGGYGAPIVSGLAINDIPTVLTGAIPAALMALAAYLLFEIMDRFLIPRGLR